MLNTTLRPSRPSCLRSWVYNGGLIALSVLVALMGLEIALHFTPYRYLLTRDRHLRYYYQLDPVKGFDIRPNVKKIPLSVDNRVAYHIWSNELGCFDEPYHGEDRYILLMGDSFTHSFAPFADKWGTQIEKLLNYRVLKCGVTGYGTGQELEKAKEIIQKINKKPQLIIVGYFWNDISDDDSFPNLTVVDGFMVPSMKYKDPKTDTIAAEKLAKKYSWWEKLFSDTYPLRFDQVVNYYLDQHLIVMNLINDAAVRLLPGKKFAYANANRFVAFQEDKPWVLKAWKRNLQKVAAFKELAAANQARLLLVLIPTNTQVYPFLASHEGLDLERPNKIMGAFLQAQGIDYLDLLPFLRAYADATPRPTLNPEKDFYWRHNSHFSIRGEHLVGLLVARYILEHKLVQASDCKEKLGAIEAKLQDFR